MISGDYVRSVKPYLVLFLGIAQMRAFTLIRENEFQRIYVYPHNPTKDFFPMYDIEMTLRTYVYFASSHIAMMSIYWFISVMTKMHYLFALMFWLEFLDLIDYFVVYNKAYPIGIKYGDIKLIIQLIAIFFTWTQSFKSYSSR